MSINLVWIQLEKLKRDFERLKSQSERAEIAGSFIRRTYAELYDTSTAALVDRWTNGMIVFCSDGLKTGESTGNGTGIPVYWDNDTQEWLRFSDDSVVTI